MPVKEEEPVIEIKTGRIPTVSDCFFEKRIHIEQDGWKTKNSGDVTKLFLIAFGPFVIPLLILRVLYFFIIFVPVNFFVSHPRARNIVLKFVLPFMGVYVRHHGAKKLRGHDAPHILVSNWSSEIDWLALQGSDGAGWMERALKKKGSAVYLPGEAVKTSGIKGLLAFESDAFSVPEGQSIAPVAVRAESPFGIMPSAWGASRWVDLIFALVVPMWFFDVTVLPPVQRRAGETPAQLARRVQSEVARSLGAYPTRFTKSDYEEALKKKTAARLEKKGQ